MPKLRYSEVWRFDHWLLFQIGETEALALVSYTSQYLIVIQHVFQKTLGCLFCQLSLVMARLVLKVAAVLPCAMPPYCSVAQLACCFFTRNG